jgi:hypothetical protein
MRFAAGQMYLLARVSGSKVVEGLRATLAPVMVDGNIASRRGPVTCAASRPGFVL